LLIAADGGINEASDYGGASVNVARLLIKPCDVPIWQADA
jgi:hypothetical protein